jgi:hypothetical protein
MGSMKSVLECAGLRGYLPTLLFWSMLPPIFAGLILLCSLLRLCLERVHLVRHALSILRPLG